MGNLYSRGAGGRKNKRKLRNQHSWSTSSLASTLTQNSAEVKMQLTNAQIGLVRRLWQSARSQGADEPGRSIVFAMAQKSNDVSHAFALTDHRKLSEARNVNAARARSQSVCPNASVVRNLVLVPGIGQLAVESLDGSPQKSPSPSRRRFSESRNTACLIAHAKYITDLLDLVIENLHSPDKIDEIILNCGDVHAAWRDCGFDAAFLHTFSEAIMQKSLLWGNRNQRGESTYQAWAQIVCLITHRFRYGYFEAVKRSLAEEQNY